MDLDKLKTELRGELVEPGDPTYEESRKVYNGMIDRKPKYIIFCENVRDVITAVNFSRENDIRTSIRGGGHHAAGMGVCDDGLVIDLSNIDYVHVDPYTKSAHVGGGATWGQVDHATHAFGLATPSGFISTTGVGGLTLGGGIGYLNRNYGLTIDNLISANVVLADGRFVTASADRNEDLFWALRGGGGNFGVVTSFKFKLHEVSEVYGGPMLWELEEAENVMKWYREFIVNAPNTINGFFTFLVVPPGPPFPEHLHNKKMCGIVWCYSGRMNRAEDSFKPIRDVGNIALDLTGPVPYPVFQRMFDELLYSGLHMYWKADYMTELSDEAIREHIKHGSTVPTLRSTMHMYPVNGVVHEVDKSETAWSYREANWAQVIVGVSPDPNDKEMITQWATDYWDALHPHSSGGAYINFMMEEGQDRVEASYGNKYKRLQKVKAKYDAENFFNVNLNIKPTNKYSNPERIRPAITD